MRRRPRKRSGAAGRTCSFVSEDPCDRLQDTGGAARLSAAEVCGGHVLVTGEPTPAAESAGSLGYAGGMLACWAPAQKSVLTRSQAGSARESPRLGATGGSGEVRGWGGITQGTWGARTGQLNLRDVIGSWGPDSDFLPEHRPLVPGAENAKHLAGLVQTGNRAGSQPEKYGGSPHCPGRGSPVMHRNLPNCFLHTFTRAKCFFKKTKETPNGAQLLEKEERPKRPIFWTRALENIHSVDPPFS